MKALPIDKDMPCSRDCKGRTRDCKVNCERYRFYERKHRAKLMKAYKERLEEGEQIDIRRRRKKNLENNFKINGR